MGTLFGNDNFSVDHSPGSYHEFVVLKDLLALSAQLSLPSVLGLFMIKNGHRLSLERGLLVMNQVIVNLSMISHVDSSCRRLLHQRLPVLSGLIFKTSPH